MKRLITFIVFVLYSYILVGQYYSKFAKTSNLYNSGANNVYEFEGYYYAISNGVHEFSKDSIAYWQDLTKTELTCYNDRGEKRFPTQLRVDNLLVRPEVSWTATTYNNFTNTYQSGLYKFSSDSSVINGKYYHTLLKTDDELGNSFVSEDRYIRESNNRVYEYSDGKEYLIYDFNAKTGDTIHLIDPSSQTNSTYIVVKTENTNLLNNDERRVLYLKCLEFPDAEIVWIDGIGTEFGPVMGNVPCGAFDIDQWLNCFYFDGKLIFKNRIRSKCWETTNVEESINSHSINLYPNPSEHKFMIHGIQNETEISIYTPNGILVERKKINQDTHLDISNLKSGVYIVKMKDSLEKLNFVRKIIKL